MAEEDNYASMRSDFNKKFNEIILPLILKYEKARRTKLKLALSLSILLLVLGMCLTYKLENIEWGLALLISSILPWRFIKKNFENKIKKKIMPTVCSCFGDMKWHEGSYADGNLFKSSCLISDYSTEIYDDIFYASYHDVNVEIVESEYKKTSGDDATTIFNGVIVKLNMNKHFKGHTIIKPNDPLNTSPSLRLHHTSLEDPEFNKQFNVYTDDEVEARYLITPSFMERLKNIRTAFKVRTSSCVFYNNLLMIALPTSKDLFSICSLIKPINDPDQFYQMYDEIESIVKLIDHFKLNQKIGL